jgi:hypothetical protein
MRRRRGDETMTRRHFEDWLFFLSAWLGTVARAGETWPDGTLREVSWGAGVAATMSWRQFVDGEA